MSRHVKLILALALLLLLAPAGEAAWAGEDAPAVGEPPQERQNLGEITVKAEKMDQDPQVIPAAITVYQGKLLYDLKADKSSDIFHMVPNLFKTEVGPQAGEGYQVSLRGISSFMGGNPPVSILVDEVYYPGLNFDLFDLEQVAVLRGPQGTLYGPNTEAGVIAITTRQAGEEWSGRLGLSAANYNTYLANFAVGGALVPQTFYLRLAGRYETTDGYFSNSYDGSDKVDEHQNLDARLSLRWRANPDLTLSLINDLQNYNSNYAEYALLSQVENDPHQVDVDYPGKADKKAGGSVLKVEQRLSSLRLVSITSYRKEDIATSQDLDFTSWDVMRLDVDQDYQSVNQEFRLVSDQPGAKLKYVAGAYFYLEDDEQSINMQMRPLSGYSGYLLQKGDIHTFGAAVFAQGTYTMFKVLELTAGLRYDRQQKDFDYNWSGGAYGVPDQKGSSDSSAGAWLPKLALSWLLSPSLTPYATISRGYNAGGFNLRASPGQTYDPEYAWNYEAGLKTQWLDNRLIFNLSFFYIDWSDLQVEQPDYPDYTVVNAASAHSYGAEAEFKALPLPELQVFGSLGLMRATFDDFQYEGVDNTDNDVPNVPEYTFNLGAVYRFARHFFAAAELYGVGGFYWDAANTEQQSAYQVVNARIGYEREHFQVFLWSKNLLDENYATRAFDMSGQWYGRAGDPLTFGVTAVFSF